MALSLLTYATDNSSVSSEMIFVINEATKANDPITYPNYKYVADIYVSGVFKARLKAQPDPDNKYGIFDVSKVLQPYFTYGMTVYDMVDYDVRLDYYIQFGEEYSDTLYTNLLTDSTRYAAKTYRPRPFTTSAFLATGLASNMPSTITCLGNPIDFQLIPYFSSVSGVTDLTVTYKDESGNTLNTATFSNAAFTANKIRVYNVLNSLVNTSYALFTGPFTLRINYECTKHPIRYLAWLNPYGGYESMTFGLVSKKSIDTERKAYTQLPYRVANGGAVTYAETVGTVFYGGRRGFASSVKTRYKLTSHLLNEDEYTWLADLFISPDVYFYLDAVGWVPCQISRTNYDYNNYLNNRLSPLEFDIELSNDFNAQFL